MTDAQPDASETDASPSKVSWIRRRWVTMAVFALIIGSDYKFRTRDSTSAISGSIDVFVLIEVALYGLVGVYVFLTWKSPGRILRNSPILILAGFYLLAIMLSAFPNPPYPAFAFVRSTEMVILGLLTLAIAVQATRTDMHRFAHAFLILVAVSTVYGVIIRSKPLSRTQDGRFTWLAIHPTVSGVFLSIAMTIAFTYLIMRGERPGPRWPAWVYVVLFAIVGVALVATQTRAAVAAGVVGAMATLLCATPARRRLEVIASAALLGILVAITSTPAIEAYIARGQTVDQLETLSDRTTLWAAAVRAVERKPIFGYGVGASQGIFQKDYGLGGGHNSAINVAVDLGLTGLAVWLALVVALLIALLMLPSAADGGFRTDRALLIGVYLVIHINGIAYLGPGGVANIAATWMFVVLGWVVVTRRSWWSHAAQTG